MTRKRQTQHLFTRAPPTSLATSTHQHTVPRRHTHPHPKGHDHHPRTEAKPTSSHQHLGTLPPPHPLVPAPTHHSRDRNQISFSSPTATQPQPTAAPAQLSIRMWSTGQAHNAPPTPHSPAQPPSPPQTTGGLSPGAATAAQRGGEARSVGGRGAGGACRRPVSSYKGSSSPQVSVELSLCNCRLKKTYLRKPARGPARSAGSAARVLYRRASRAAGGGGRSGGAPAGLLFQAP